MTNEDNNAPGQQAKRESLSLHLSGDRTSHLCTDFYRKNRHSLATFALCLSSLANSYLVVSIFSYAGYMVLDLLSRQEQTHPSSIDDNDPSSENSFTYTVDNVGTYVGFLMSTFMAGRFLTIYTVWGQCADAVGRKKTLLVALMLSSVFSVLFGMAQTTITAVLWLTCLGMSNGILITTKTLASEIQIEPSCKGTDLSARNFKEMKVIQTVNPGITKRHGERLERRTMGLVVGMRSWGMLISPAIAGYLAEPLQQYPDSFASFRHQGNDELNASNAYLGPWWYQLLQTYPFILPNLFAALLSLVAALAVFLFVHETLPDASGQTKISCCSFLHQGLHGLRGSWLGLVHKLEDPQRNTMKSKTTRPSEPRLSECTPLIRHLETATCIGVATTNQDSAPNDMNGLCQEDGDCVVRPVWSQVNTRNHMIAHWLFSFVTTVIDDAFPLFCISAVGGLGLAEAQIGQVLSGAGLLFVLFQYVIFAAMTERYGLYHSMTVGCILGILPSVLIPLSVHIGHHNAAASRVYLIFVLGFLKLMHSLFFTTMAVAINKTVHTKQRARMNSIIALGNSVGKFFAPIFAGALVAFSFSSTLFPAEFGAFAVWSVIIPVLGLMLLHHVRELGLRQS